MSLVSGKFPQPLLGFGIGMALRNIEYISDTSKSDIEEGVELGRPKEYNICVQLYQYACMCTCFVFSLRSLSLNKVPFSFDKL